MVASRHPLLVVLFLALLPCVLFPGALPGPRAVSADDHLTVHHAWRTGSGDGGHVRNPELSDPAVQFRALRERVVTSWRSGHAPLWNPDLYGGVPLLADAQSAAFDPRLLADLLLPRAAAGDLRCWLLLAGAGVGTALLAWALGAGAAGGALAGTVAALSAFPVTRLLHPHAAVYAWMPWLAWAVARVGRGRGGPLPVALTLAGLLVSGHFQTAMHGLLLAGGVAAGTIRDRRALARLGVGLGTGLLLAAPAWLPFAALLRESETLAVRGGDRLPVGSLATLVLPDPFGHPARGTWTGPGSHLETNLHVGLVAVGLALAGLRGRGVRLWVLGAALALAVAMGLPLLAWIPANHARLGGVAGLCLAVAAGLALPRRRGAALLVILAATELLWARRSDQATLPEDAVAPAAASWVAALQERLGDGRVLGLGWALQPNTGALVGLRDLRGYDLPVSRRTQGFMARLDPAARSPWYPVSALTPENRPLLDLGGVRVLAVVAGDREAEASVADLPEILDLDAPVRLFALDPEAGRAFVAPLSGDPVAGAARLRGRPPGARAVGVVEERPEVLRIPVDAAEAGLLVLADAWDPGWRAWVDGVARPILPVAGVYRGVALGAGDREVRMEYRPWSWAWGRGLGGVGVLVALGLAVAAGGARRSRGPRAWAGIALLAGGCAGSGIPPEPAAMRALWGTDPDRVVREVQGIEDADQRALTVLAVVRTRTEAAGRLCPLVQAPAQRYYCEQVARKPHLQRWEEGTYLASLTGLALQSQLSGGWDPDAPVPPAPSRACAGWPPGVQAWDCWFREAQQYPWKPFDPERFAHSTECCFQAGPFTGDCLHHLVDSLAENLRAEGAPAPGEWRAARDGMEAIRLAILRHRPAAADLAEAATWSAFFQRLYPPGAPRLPAPPLDLFPAEALPHLAAVGGAESPGPRPPPIPRAADPPGGSAVTPPAPPGGGTPGDSPPPSAP